MPRHEQGQEASARLFQRVSKAFRYALGADWNVVDALISRCDVHHDERLGGILRRLGFAFVAVRAQEKEAEKAP